MYREKVSQLIFYTVAHEKWKTVFKFVLFGSKPAFGPLNILMC